MKIPGQFVVVFIRFAGKRSIWMKNLLPAAKKGPDFSSKFIFYRKKG